MKLLLIGDNNASGGVALNTFIEKAVGLVEMDATAFLSRYLFSVLILNPSISVSLINSYRLPVHLLASISYLYQIFLLDHYLLLVPEPNVLFIVVGRIVQVSTIYVFHLSSSLS